MTLPCRVGRHTSERPPRAPSSATRWLLQMALVIAAGLALATPALAQTSTIAGTVFDAENNPIAAAQVSITGTRYATVTDNSGRYRLGGLSDPVGTAVTVTARRIGYRSASVAAHIGDEHVDFLLQVQAVNLNEVVVTGTPGGTEKRSLGVDVAQIDASTLVEAAPIHDVQQLLNGRTPGVTLLQNSGVIGAGSTVRIRGVSSLSLTNQPLIYVDGVRIDNSQSTGTSNQGFGANTTTRWNDFNPDDIESVEIVKGPAATTLYGTEAANGVIQIITKKGSQGKATWDFNMRQGANWFSNPEGRLWRNFGVVSGDTTSITYSDLVHNYGQPIFTTGHLQGYDANVGGGSQTLRYFVSGGYSNDRGVEPSNRQRQYNARASLGIFPNDKLDIQTNAAYIVGHTDLPYEAGAGGATWTSYYATPANNGPPHLGFYSGLPSAYYSQYQLFQSIDRFTGSAQLNHHPVSWFNQRLVMGIDQGYEDSEELSGVHHENRVFFSEADSGYKIVDTRNTRVFSASYAGNLIFPVTSTIRSTTSIGGDVIKHDGKYVNGYGEDFPTPGLTALSSTTSAQSTSETDTLINTVGVFAQEEFGWRDKVFITGGVRLDNNSSFGSKFRNVYYPKVSGAWVLSEEPFFHIPSVSTLKLRAAYGESGQAPLPYSSEASFTAVAGPGGAGVTPFRVGNPNLGPERGYETEIGFDAGLLHDRAGVEFTFYTGGTKDAILETQVPPSLGYPGTQFINAGRLTKHGFELALHGSPIMTNSTQWTLGLNLATADNKVTDLNGAQFIQASTLIRHTLGYPVGSWFDRKVVGSMVNSDGSISNVVCDDGTSAHHAIPCADAPVEFLGRTIPNFEASATSTLRIFKNFSFFVMVDSKRGYKKLNGNDRVRCHLFHRCESNFFPQNLDPALVGAESGGSAYASDLIQDASFVKLREVSVTYTLPQIFASTLRAQNASISLAGRNLHTWTKYAGLDPEASFQGGSRGFGQWEQDVTPQLMQFVTTVRLTF